MDGLGCTAASTAATNGGCLSKNQFLLSSLSASSKGKVIRVPIRVLFPAKRDKFRVLAKKDSSGLKIQEEVSKLGMQSTKEGIALKRKTKRLDHQSEKENEELLEHKRNVMAKLSLGDVVKCVVQKITYIGIFVEVEGAPALIHQSEVSWDATLDPATSFKIGQTLEAKVHLLDFTRERIYLSLKEEEAVVDRKKVVMAKLHAGDVVKCVVQNITHFGIFVKVEGVSALIHQSEVSWDATLDPASSFQVGQVLKAKVHKLDFARQRIYLSLKELMPDPLIRTLESVVEEQDSLDGQLEVPQPGTNWDDVEALIKELEQVEGIQSVSKGRFFSSPGLAPTFQPFCCSTGSNDVRRADLLEIESIRVSVQKFIIEGLNCEVYMASMVENQYKLLARSGNKVQEVLVQSSMDKEEMKYTILLCTNRVE